MVNLPIWLFAGALVGASFIFFIVGVILCYRSTPRIGDMILTRDDEDGQLYLFLELNKPLEAYAGQLKDGKEVLTTVRVKNSQ